MRLMSSFTDLSATCREIRSIFRKLRDLVMAIPVTGRAFSVHNPFGPPPATLHTHHDEGPRLGVRAAGCRSGGLDDVLDDLPGHGLVAVLAHGATPVAELEELLGALDHLLLRTWQK